MSDRIEVTTTDGEVIGCYIGDRLTHQIFGVSGVILGAKDNKVQLRPDGHQDVEIEITADNLQSYWE